jgi:hypothetical protein
VRDLVCQLLGKRDANVWRRCLLREYDGIRIVDRSHRKDLQRDFVLRTCQALDLVALRDPRRYRRIRKYLHFIVHRELAFATAKYYRWPSACIVDFGKLSEDLLRERPVRDLCFHLAATLIHEATHGFLLSRPLKKTSDGPTRMERICIIEEMRFAARVSPKFRDAYRNVYSDWSRWRQRYEARPRLLSWRGFVAHMRRHLESARRSNQQSGANGRHPVRSEASQTSAAAASRRSP